MAITDIPIFSMLRTKLQYSQERQRVLSENVANVDTPNYRARDLKAPVFPALTQACAAFALTRSMARRIEESFLRRKASRGGSVISTTSAANRQETFGGNALPDSRSRSGCRFNSDYDYEATRGAKVKANATCACFTDGPPRCS